MRYMYSIVYIYIYKFQQENDIRLSQIGGKTGFTPENDQHTEGYVPEPASAWLVGKASINGGFEWENPL